MNYEDWWVSIFRPKLLAQMCKFQHRYKKRARRVGKHSLAKETTVFYHIHPYGWNVLGFCAIMMIYMDEIIRWKRIRTKVDETWRLYSEPGHADLAIPQALREVPQKCCASSDFLMSTLDPLRFWAKYVLIQVLGFVLLLLTRVDMTAWC